MLMSRIRPSQQLVFWFIVWGGGGVGRTAVFRESSRASRGARPQNLEESQLTLSISPAPRATPRHAGERALPKRMGASAESLANLRTLICFARKSSPFLLSSSLLSHDQSRAARGLSLPSREARGVVDRAHVATLCEKRVRLLAMRPSPGRRSMAGPMGLNFVFVLWSADIPCVAVGC